MIVVQRRFVADLADAAVIVVADALEAAEALDDARAFRADQQPIHAEEAQRRRVEQEIDDLVLLQVAFAREGERIDAKQRLVIGGADMAFELRDQPRAPGARLFQTAEPLIEQGFVHGRGHMSPPHDRAWHLACQITGRLSVATARRTTQSAAMVTNGPSMRSTARATRLPTRVELPFPLDLLCWNIS